MLLLLHKITSQANKHLCAQIKFTSCRPAYHKFGCGLQIEHKEHLKYLRFVYSTGRHQLKSADAVNVTMKAD